MRKVLWMIVCFMTMVTSANAQNIIVDEFKADKPSEKKRDILLLSPNESIKKNYTKIDSLMSLHREKNYAEYIIVVQGHYTNKSGDFYDRLIGMIHVKLRDGDIYYHTINEEIKEVLTTLYSYSLDECFNVEFDEYYASFVNEEQIKVKVETGRTFKCSDGKVTKEYVEEWRKIGGNILYRLFPTSSLFKKIKGKVISEIYLKNNSNLYMHVLEEAASTKPHKVINNNVK